MKAGNCCYWPVKEVPVIVYIIYTLWYLITDANVDHSGCLGTYFAFLAMILWTGFSNTTHDMNSSIMDIHDGLQKDVVQISGLISQ